MAEVSRELDQIQRWIQSVITHPGGAAAGADAEEAQRILGVEAATLERVVTRSRSLSALDRLDIYANAYFARLLECLRSEFPVLQRAVGEDVFGEFAIGYLQSYPPRSYSLNRLGEHFARYLSESRVDDDGWADLIIDLASLEWAIGAVFDGPGCEGQGLLDVQQLWAVPAARQPAVVLDTVPCLRLLRLRFPLRDYYSALRDEQEAMPPERSESFLALTRRNYVVRLHDLTGIQYALLSALQEGECLGRAIERIAATAGSDAEELGSNLGCWFREWAEAGFFRAAIDPASTPPDS